jgi:hypothetical protein
MRSAEECERDDRDREDRQKHQEVQERGAAPELNRRYGAAEAVLQSRDFVRIVPRWVGIAQTTFRAMKW